MACEIIDGFDHYSQANMLEEGWINPGGLSVVGRFGGNGWQAFNSAHADRVLPFGSLASRVIGFALLPGGNVNAIATVTDVFRISDGGTATANVQLQLRLVSGFLQIVRGISGSGGTTLATATTGPTMLSGLWYYVEIKVTIHPSAGSVEVHVSDGVASTVVINITGVNTQNTANATFDTISFIGQTAVSSNIYDDFYSNDLTGSVNNDFEGESRIQTQNMAVNGHLHQWTPLSSTNISNIDEVHGDNDTTYNLSSTVGQIDTFVPLPLTVTGPIAAVQLNINARKDDVSARAVSGVVSDGTTDHVNATSHGLFSTYTNLRDMYETNPNTSAAWTQTSFNAAQFGYKMNA